MQKQNTPGRHAAAASAHFTRLAEDTRRQLSDIQIQIIQFQKNNSDADRSNAMHRKYFELLDQLKYRERELKDRLNRALFNAGRI